MANARRAPDEFYRQGLEHARLGRHGEAIACFETAIAERPNDARILFALGNTAETIGHASAAEAFFRRVLDEEPGRVEALVKLGNLLRANGRTGDAIALLKPALERNPEESALWLTLGSAVREEGDGETAKIFYREALRLHPANAAALGNLADLAADSGSLDEALGLYAEALKLEPKNAQAHLNRAFLYFLKGDFSNGWRDYEHRLRIKSRAIVQNHRLKRWKGAVTKNLRLLVTAEQGIGDQIMFASLVPELAASLAQNGGRLLLEAEPRLVPLFARSFETVTVAPSHILDQGGTKIAQREWLKRGDADAAIELGSLAQFLRQSQDDFAAGHAYLKPDAARRAHWAAWLRERSPEPLAGLCWRSGLTGGLRNRQYAPLSAWGDFIRQLTFTPVALQYDAREDEIAALKAMSGRDILVPPFDQKQEIGEAAALMAALDCVVSAPTSVAWISAALGVPTLKLVRDSAWTAFGKDYEPFAPSARIIAPERPGDWHDCFDKALQAVSAFR